MSDLHLFGIRHHGPGSARSLVNALRATDPDIVLIEGPPDADEILPLAARDGLEPPVALLIHASQSPQSAVLYPFAHYSPEWQALRFALARGLPLRFIDLPQSVRMAAADEEPEDAGTDPVRGDPLGPLAEAAGHGDVERWWDAFVESRSGQDTDVFAALHEMIGAVRAELAVPESLQERRREAHMRRCIRVARSEGFARIAVVCGAYHTPALAAQPSAREDDALLKSLPKVRTEAAWVPWSYERLSYRSGYGAGVDSPVWYELLWEKRAGLGPEWLARAARLLRDEDLAISSAHVIEACRLADALAAVRGRPVAGLAEYNDAAVSVLGAGSALPLELIRRRWYFGDRLGQVPEDFPAPPLQRDLAALQKRLRFPAKLEERSVDLDLREAIDRERSHMLRRLRLLDVAWGTPARQAGGRGTFHEPWQVRWQPEFAVALIAASRYGHTLEQAASGVLAERAAGDAALAELIALLEDALFADLPQGIAVLVAAIEQRAALATDVLQSLDALAPLVNVHRYGNVRETDVSLVAQILAGLVPRVLVAVPSAAANIDDDAARALWQRLRDADRALAVLASAAFTAGWRDMLGRLARSEAVHPLVGGYAHRLLYDAGALERDALSTTLASTLSRGSAPAAAAAWIEGFLSGSGAVLLHDDALRELLDVWVRGASPENFVQVLPLLRRTFAQLPATERRQIGERLRAGETPLPYQEAPADFDEASARAVLPILRRIWGREPQP